MPVGLGRQSRTRTAVEDSDGSRGTLLKASPRSLRGHKKGVMVRVRRRPRRAARRDDSRAHASCPHAAPSRARSETRWRRGAGATCQAPQAGSDAAGRLGQPPRGRAEPSKADLPCDLAAAGEPHDPLWPGRRTRSLAAGGRAAAMAAGAEGRAAATPSVGSPRWRRLPLAPLPADQSRAHAIGP
jgi:hypothetical protein